jgi:hypothetical protein
MLSSAWFRKLFSMGRSQRSPSKQRSLSDSLVPQLSIKRLEERLVLNADAAPVEVLVVNAGDAAADGQADVYHVEQVDNEIRVSVNGQEVQSIAADRVSAIQITGSADNDVLVADLLAGVNLIFDGGGGQDSILLEGGDYDLVGYEVSDGTTAIAAHSTTGIAQVQLTGVEQVNDSLRTTNREFSFDGSAKDIVLGKSTESSYSSRFLVSSTGITIDFLNPSDSLAIDTSANGEGADNVTVEGLGDGFDADLRISGGVDDKFELNGDIDLGRGNLAISTGSVVLNQSITSAQASFELDADKHVTINSEAALFNAGGHVKVTAPEISLRGMVAAAGGFVSLDSGVDGVTKVEGEIDVAHLAEGGQGGKVHILGKNVQLLGTARIDASGHSGGGTVLVGGGYQGSDASVRNGQYTFVDSRVVVNVDAVFAGFGGMAIFWADKATGFYGTVTARGGAMGGDGGFIEISGKEGLAFKGWADAAAPAGKVGTVLFDPTNITIHDGAGGDSDDDDKLPDLSGESGAFNLSETALEALLATANIVLTASGNITLNNLTDNVLDLLTAAGSLTIIADSDNAGGGTFSMNSGDTIQTAGGSISIKGNALNLGGLTSAGGDITIVGDAVTLSNAVDAGTGIVRIVANGNVTQTPTGLITAGTLGVRQEGNTGNITLAQANDVDQFAAFNTDEGGTVQFIDADGFAVSSVAALGDFDETDGIVTDDGNVTLQSGAALDVNADITTNGGNFTVTTTTTFDSTGQTIDTSGADDDPGGTVQITATGQLTVGAIDTSGGDDDPMGGNGLAAGDVTLSGGDITITGIITAAGSDNAGAGTTGGAGGDVNLTATDGTPTITLSAGINSAGGSGATTGAGGDITFNDAVTVTAPLEISAGTGEIEFNSSLASGANALTLTANEIDFDGGANSISGSGVLVLQPGQAGFDINIGNLIASLTALDLTTTDLTALADGFANITIGRSNGAHDIDVDAASFKDAVTIRTPNGGSIDVQGQLDTLAGGGSITLDGAGADITLSDDVITAGFAIDIQGDVTVVTDLLLDSTNAGGVAGGAAINISGSINGDGGVVIETLTINAGTGGTVTLDDIGDSVAQGTNLTIANSNSTTISGVASVATLNIQDTTNTVAIQGNATITTLTTAVQPYGISLTGASNTITNDANFLNTGAITLGNDAGDIIRFLGGISTTGGPSQLNLHGQLRTSGDQIDLGPVVLQGTSVIDATNNGGTATGANINVGAVTGDNRTLTIDAGTNGDVALTTVGAVGASLAAINVEADDVILANDVIADAQDYDADVSTTALLDTTDGGGNAAGGAITISGELSGAAPQLNGGTGGVITIGSVDVTTLTIVNSGSTTISGVASIATLDIQDTTGTVTIQGNATITTLTTAAQGYGVALLGSNSTITNDTDFLNTGAVTLGNNASGVILFDGGIDTTTGPSQTNLFGRLRTSGDQIDLTALNLQGDSIIDSTNNNGVATGASINLSSISGGGNDLELNAGTTSSILVTGAAASLGELTITQTLAATFLGNLSAASLITTAQPYSLALLGTTNSVTNDVNFLNTGTLTLGNSATDTFTFNGGLDTTSGPTAFNLFGRLRTSGDQIDLAAVTLLGNSEIDATVGAAAGANINMGTISGDNLTLAMNAGNSGDVSLAAVGAAGSSLASFVLIADTATLTANVVADSQNYAANLTLAEGSNILLDTTDGGLLLFTGPINVTGSINGTAGGGTEILRLDAGILGAITLDDLGNTTSLNVTIFNSLSTTIDGMATLGVLVIVDTTLDVSILGNADIDTLATTAQPYNISILGSNSEITNDTNFFNTGTVTLGNDAADILLFNGGISTTLGPSQTNLFGQLRTSGNQIDLNSLVLQGDSQIDSTNTGGVATGANINTGTITGVGNDLTFNAGTAGNLAFGQVGAIANAIGDLAVTMAQGVTALGTIDAASLVQSAGTGTTNLQGLVTVTNDLDIETVGNVLVNGVVSNLGSIRLAGEIIVISANMTATAASQEIVLTANNNAANAIQLGLLTVLTTAEGSISGQALLPTVLNMSVNTGLPLAPPDLIIGMLQVFINDTFGTNFTVEIDWRISERPGIPAPAAVPVVPPAQNLTADVISSAVDGVVFVQFDHQYDDNPEPNPGDDINVRLAITEFAGDTIRLSRAGTDILANDGITTNIVVPVDVPLFGFVLVPSPGALPVTPPPAPPANPFNPPVVQIIQVTNNPFEPNSAGVTGRAEVRYYELRIVSFDENGKLIESLEERINLSDPRLEAITPFNPSKLPELFKRLPGDRYRIYLIEDGAERLMIEFVIEQVGDEGRPVELPEKIETEGQGARLQNDANPALELQNRAAWVPEAPVERPAGQSFVEELGRASFVSSGGLVFGAAMLSKKARQQREAQADQRMAAFRKRLRVRSSRNCDLN